MYYRAFSLKQSFMLFRARMNIATCVSVCLNEYPMIASSWFAYVDSSACGD